MAACLTRKPACLRVDSDSSSIDKHEPAEPLVNPFALEKVPTRERKNSHVEKAQKRWSADPEKRLGFSGPVNAPSRGGGCDPCSKYICDSPKYRLSLDHVRQALRAHSHGLNQGIPLDALSSHVSTGSALARCLPMPTALRQDLTVYAKISETGNLLLGAQYRFWNEHAGKERFYALLKKSPFQPCAHSGLVVPERCQCRIDGTLSGQISCRMDHVGEWYASCTFCSGYKRCQHCPTEYAVRVEDAGAKGHILLLNVWRDLGDAESCERHWRCLGNMPPGSQIPPPDPRLFPLHASSVRRVFPDFERAVERLRGEKSASGLRSRARARGEGEGMAKGDQLAQRQRQGYLRRPALSVHGSCVDEFLEATLLARRPSGES
ncbi:hypothetical protein LTR28_010346 [Elasticomyces elasticus]|nr:hypothetical protein LTR28_010346 [Elasticomyces elasticus]